MRFPNVPKRNWDQEALSLTSMFFLGLLMAYLDKRILSTAASLAVIPWNWFYFKFSKGNPQFQMAKFILFCPVHMIISTQIS